MSNNEIKEGVVQPVALPRDENNAKFSAIVTAVVDADGVALKLISGAVVLGYNAASDAFIPFAVDADGKVRTTTT